MNSKQITVILISIPWLIFLVQGYYLALVATGPVGGLFLLTLFWLVLGAFTILIAEDIAKFIRRIGKDD